MKRGTGTKYNSEENVTSKLEECRVVRIVVMMVSRRGASSTGEGHGMLS
jgi:hypothetical protein